MRKELIFSIVIFLLLLPVIAFAYEEFNHNPYYNIDVLGTGIVDYGFNATYSFPDYLKCFDSQWNATYQGKTGVLLLTNNHCLNFTMDGITLGIATLLNSNFQHSGNATANADFFLAQGDMVLPKNHEGIIFVRYYISDNSNIDPTSSRLEYSVAGAVSSESINLTQAVWHDKIIYVDANVTHDRTIGSTLYLIFSTGGAVNYAQIAIDSFKLFTLDLNEVRQYWSGNETYEMERYCGVGAIEPCASDEPNFQVFILKNGKTAMLLANTTENITCGTFKLGNLTIARRIITAEANPVAGVCDWCGNQLYVMRDAMFYNFRYQGMGSQCNNILTWFIEGHSLTQAIFTDLNVQVQVGAGTPVPTDWYNGIPVATVNWNATCWNYPNATREIIDLVVSPALPAGTQFKYASNLGFNSSYYDFFWTPITCDVASICEPISNYQYIQTATCELIDPLWCGEWGCSPDSTTCAFGIIGDSCLNNFTLKHVSSNGTVTFDYCPTGEVCVELTSTTAQCMTPEQADIQEWYSEPLNKTGETVGYFLGWDMATFLMSLSIIVSLAVPAYITYKVKEAGIGGLGIIFGIGFIGILLMFTMAGWVNVLLFIVLLILSGMLIAWQIVKAVGG